ncbi:MAG: protein translocase subunit SecDF [Hymenobacteraceae bacterium]|nr:protein translocase subunit SecDF [Hymenobacteraceae bacterium]
MRNKGLVVTLTIIVAALCSWYLLLTYQASKVEDRANAFATRNGKIDESRRNHYLDSVWNQPAFLNYTYQDLKKSELSKGLDLKGGMHVTMEVSPVEILRSMAGHSQDPSFQKALQLASQRQRESQEPFTSLFLKAYREVAPDGKLGPLFANSSNKGQLSYASSNDDVIKVVNKEVESAIERSFNILRTRIDKLGTTQPNIQRLKGTGRIQIELPGVQNPERVRKMLQGQAKLEFWEVYKPQEVNPYLVQLNDFMLKQEAAEQLAGGTTPDAKADDALANAATKELSVTADSASTDSTSLAAQLDGKAKAADSTTKGATAKTDSLNSKQAKAMRYFVPLPSGLGANVRDTAKVNALFARADVRALFPPNMTPLWGVKPLEGQKRDQFLEMYFVKKSRSESVQAPVSGEYVTNATQDYDQQGRAEVLMAMNPTGARKWQKLTGANIGRQVAIVLDNYVYSAPNVQSEIGGGSSSISGSFTIEEAQDLANVLKIGKLPAPTRIIEEAVVGPSLGQEAISRGLLSTLAGIGVIMLFMIGYYNRGGLVADIALLVNLFFIMGILAQFGTALTLPGIAGIVLTLALAVDANVLVYERVREELAHGLTVKDAIAKAYHKAFSAIFDANVTTLLIALVLGYFGSGPVRGFATTLGIGVFTSFLTSLYLSRVIIEALVSGKEENQISFKSTFSRVLFKNPNFDFIGKRKIAYAFSTAILVIGFAIMFMQGGPLLGVDFKGGRSYVVEFAQAIPAADAREAVLPGFQNAGTEAKTYGGDRRLKITTSYLADDESASADKKVEESLMSSLNTRFGAAKPQILSTAKVGATMADDIKQSAVVSLLVALAGIFLYVMLRFGGRWEFSFGAVLSLFHDALFLFAGFAIARLFGLNYEMDQVFIAAVLTVVGFSMNDTVVIYDRLREYLKENPRLTFAQIANPALNSTLSRTLITSTTIFLVVLVLYIFGGETLRSFSFAMLIGVVFGTYSSIFVASAIIYDTISRTKSGAELMHSAPGADDGGEGDQIPILDRSLAPNPIGATSSGLMGAAGAMANNPQSLGNNPLPTNLPR